MRIIPPVTVTPAMLTSNVPITETEWTAGTYPLGTQRYVGTVIYEVVDAAGTSDEPTAGAAKDVPTWIQVRSINQFRAFNFVIGDATIYTGTISLEITPGSVVDSVLFFNIFANSVRVRMVDPIAGEVYDKTSNLSAGDGSVGSWFGYFFDQTIREDAAVFTNLPLYKDAVLHITIEPDATGDAEVGEIVIGRQDIIGDTMMNFSLSIEDFSRKERDTFGNFQIVERRFAKLANYDIFLSNFQVNQTFRKLANVRATPVVFIGDPDRVETLTLGFYRNFTMLRTGPNSSEMTLEIEGLT